MADEVSQEHSDEEVRANLSQAATAIIVSRDVAPPATPVFCPAPPEAVLASDFLLTRQFRIFKSFFP